MMPPAPPVGLRNCGESMVAATECGGGDRVKYTALWRGNHTGNLADRDVADATPPSDVSSTICVTPSHCAMTTPSPTSDTRAGDEVVDVQGEYVEWDVAALHDRVVEAPQVVAFAQRRFGAVTLAVDLAVSHLSLSLRTRAAARPDLRPRTRARRTMAARSSWEPSSATPFDSSSSRPGSPRWRCSASRWASAPMSRCSASSTRCSCGRSPITSPIASSG